jgi:zinc D-Ala-D-Ala carboxypeptidase
MNLSPHFTLAEATFSERAAREYISNLPDKWQMSNMLVAATGMEQIRTLLGNVEIRINSWLRVAKLNAVTPGSSIKSDHMTGSAVDFVAPEYGSPFEIASRIAASDVQFDQLIYEYTWVHVSFRPGNRRSILTLQRGGGYINGLHK